MKVLFIIKTKRKKCKTVLNIDYFSSQPPNDNHVTVLCVFFPTFHEGSAYVKIHTHTHTCLKRSSPSPLPSPIHLTSFSSSCLFLLNKSGDNDNRGKALFFVFSVIEFHSLVELIVLVLPSPCLPPRFNKFRLCFASLYPQQPN